MPKDQGYPIRLDISDPNNIKAAPARKRSTAGSLTNDALVKTALTALPASAQLGLALYGAAADSSGGELPRSAQGKGATDKPDQLTTRPKSSAALYDELLAASMRGLAAQQGGFSIGQLAKLGQAVPTPPKPLSIEDVARSQVLEGINQQYQTAISAADAAGDYDEVARLYAEREPRLIALFDTTASLLAQAQNNKD